MTSSLFKAYFASIWLIMADKPQNHLMWRMYSMYGLYRTHLPLVTWYSGRGSKVGMQKDSRLNWLPEIVGQRILQPINQVSKNMQPINQAGRGRWSPSPPGQLWCQRTGHRTCSASTHLMCWGGRRASREREVKPLSTRAAMVSEDRP